MARDVTGEGTRFYHPKTKRICRLTGDLVLVRSKDGLSEDRFLTVRYCDEAGGVDFVSVIDPKTGKTTLLELVAEDVSKIRPEMRDKLVWLEGENAGDA